MAGLASVWRALVWARHEFGWWVSRVARLVVGRLTLIGVMLLATSVLVWFHITGWFVPFMLLGAARVVSLGWQRGWPASYDRRVVQPRFRRRVRRGVLQGWRGLMESAGLVGWCRSRKA